MSQSWVAVRDAIKPIVESVSGVQIVHAFPRIEQKNHIARWKRFMTTTSRIDAWTILRTGGATRYITTCEVEMLHQVTIRGILELDDANSSQDEFDIRVDALMVKLYPAVSLDGNATLQGPAALPVEDIRIFADTVLHYAEITTVVNQTVLVTGRS